MQKRLFVGTLLPDEELDLLSRLRDELEPRLARWWHCKLRWVKPSKLHTTWLFLGSCDDATQKEVNARLESAAAQLHSTELKYDSIELFPNKSHPVALVLLPASIPEGVKQISALLRKDIGQFCEKKEDRPFRPHLTLLRFPKDLHEKLIWKDNELKLEEYLPLTQTFKSFSLIESHLGQSRDGYEILRDYQLIRD